MHTEDNFEKQVKVTLFIQLKNLEGADYDFQQFINFLDGIELVHLKSLALSQSNHNLQTVKISNRKNYPKLRLEKIEMNSPLSLVLSFTINLDDLFPYLFFVKAFFRLCKRYGRDIQNLEETIDGILKWLLKILKKSTVIRRRISPETIGFMAGKDIGKLRDLIQLILKDPSFRRTYNFFCKSGITFTEFVSVIEILDEEFRIDLLD
jgi:hypothetical protein